MNPKTPLLGAAAVLTGLASGCFAPSELRDRADADALALVDQRRQELFGEDGAFSLPTATASFGRAPRPVSQWTTRELVLAGEIDAVGPLNVISALEIAAEDSQDVQEQREALYLAALDLTQDRWSFGYRYNADGTMSVGGDLDGDGSNSSTGFSASVTRILGSGAVVLANVGTSLFRFVSTGDGWDAVSNLGLSVTQPFLRGSGRLVTLEPLRQSERDLIYSVRQYERFRRTYAVSVASQVYSVMQARDRFKNEQQNFDNLAILTKRNEALQNAGQQSQIQVDQGLQENYSSETRLVQRQGDVEQALDSFKVFLGLPVDVELTFEDGILQGLAADRAFLDGLEEDLAVEFALEHRLDVMTAFDQVQDATRREAITRDALRAGLDVSASLDAVSADGRPLGYRIGDVDWATAVDLDLPVDLLPARNAWRRSEIALVRAKRDYARFLDQVTISVRRALRNAENAFVSYEIQQVAVELGERQLAGLEVSQRAGRATTRDILDAQRARRAAQDQVTSDRIAFTESLLGLWLEMEILRVDETGIFVDEAIEADLRARIEQMEPE